MDLGDLKYLDAPAKVLKLSALMREAMKVYPQGSCWDSPCALGGCAMLLGWKSGDGRRPYDVLREHFPFIQTETAVPGIRYDIELMNMERHQHGGENRAQIADMLESQGY